MADTDGAIMDTRPITATATVATPVADTAMADEVGEDLAGMRLPFFGSMGGYGGRGHYGWVLIASFWDVLEGHTLRDFVLACSTGATDILAGEEARGEKPRAKTISGRMILPRANRRGVSEY